MVSKKILVNVDLIKEQNEAVTLHSFALFIKSKLLFNNSTIYKQNTSTRKLSGLFGCSHTVTKKYLSELRKQNLLCEMNGNITFISLSKTEYKLNKKNQVKIWINSDDTLSTIATKLKFAVLKKNAEKQTFIKNLKSDLKNATMDLKLYKKYISKLSERQRVVNEDLNISNRKLAKELCCSVQSISVLKNKWAGLNLVRFTRVFDCLGKVNKKQFMLNQDLIGKHCFVSRNGYGYRFKYSKFELLGMEQLTTGLH
jgi:hypothetical protein